MARMRCPYGKRGQGDGVMSLSYRHLAIASSGICFFLALIWLVVPQLLLWVWQIDASHSALLMARRGGALFLGLGVILWRTRHADPSPARSATAYGLSVSCGILATLGASEFMTGHAGPGIWLAVAVEYTLAACFWAVRQAPNIDQFK